MGPSRPKPSGGWGLRTISVSRRDLAWQAPSANVTVFMKGSTECLVVQFK